MTENEKLRILDVLRVANRFNEPDKPGEYFVFSTWMSKSPKFICKIKAHRGPRGGYRRPIIINTNRRYYWRNGDFWMRQEEIPND
jgi:hypothetical protein